VNPLPTFELSEEFGSQLRVMMDQGKADEELLQAIWEVLLVPGLVFSTVPDGYVVDTYEVNANLDLVLSSGPQTVREQSRPHIVFSGIHPT